MGKRHSVESVRRQFGVVVILTLIALALAGCLPAAPAQVVRSPQATAAPTEQAALPTTLPTAALTVPTTTAPLPTLVPSLVPTTASATRPTAEPALPPGLVPPTATPAFPEQAISPDNLAALRQLRTIGYGSINDASAALAARLLAVATSAGVALFELPSFSLLRFTPGEARSVLLSPDGKRMLVDGRLLSTADGKTLDVIGADQARFSFDSRLIASTSSDKTTIWQSSDGELLRTIPGTQPAFSPDSSLVAVVAKTDIRIVRVVDGVPGRIIATPTGDIKSLAFSAEGQRLRAAIVHEADYRGVELREWRVLDGQLIKTLPIVIDNRYGTASGELILSPLGELLAVLSGFVEGGSGFTLYSTDDGRRFELPGRRYDQPSNVTFSADGPVAVYWDIQIYPRDDALHLLALPDMSTKELAMPVLSGLTFSPDGQTLAGVTWFGVSTWRVIDGAPQQALMADLQLPFSSGQIRYGVDGRLTLAGDSLIVYGDFGSQLTTWGAQASTVTQRWEQYLARIFAFDASGRICALLTTFDNEGPSEAPYLLDLTRGITLPLELAAPLSAAAFSPDGRLLAVGNEAGAVRLLRGDDASPAGELALGGEVLSLAFSPDGTLLVSQRADGLVQVWRIGETQPLAAMAAPLGDKLLISADNRLLISGGSAGVTFYRLETGELLRTLNVAADDLAIGPYGRLLAILHAGQALLWGIPVGSA